MNINTYSAHAILFAQDRGLALDTEQALMGLQGEIGELTDIFKKHIFHGKPLDKRHVILETGDVFWYMNLLACRHGIDLDLALAASKTADFDDPHRMAVKSLLTAGECTSMLFAAMTAGIPDTRGHYSHLLSVLCGTLKTVLVITGATLEEALEANVAKLSARYPDMKFDADRANNRDVAQEMEAISKVL